MAKKNFWKTTWGTRLTKLSMVPIIVLLNYLSVRIAIFLNIPFFLDTWATSLGVMAGGLWVGLAGGILYNLFMMTIWGSGAWVWAFASIWVALITYFLFRIGWISITKPGKLFLSGLILGLTAAVVILIILFTAWGGMETYEGVLPTYQSLVDITGSKTMAAIGEKFITVPVDQIVAIFLAAIVFSVIPEKFILSKLRKKKED